MIDTKEKLFTAIRVKYRFVSHAAKEFGFESSRDYQRFRNTLIGASKDYQVILSLLTNFPKIDTEKLWGVDKNSLKMLSKN